MNWINHSVFPYCNGMNQIPPKAKAGSRVGFISSLTFPTHSSQSVLLCLFLAVARRAHFLKVDADTFVTVTFGDPGVNQYRNNKRSLPSLTP